MKAEDIRTAICEELGYGGPFTMDKQEWRRAIEKAAATIAEACEEELNILCRERDEFEAQNLDLQAEYDGLEAQVAELAKLLSQCAEVMWGTNGMMRRAAYGTLPEQVDKALAVRGEGEGNDEC